MDYKYQRGQIFRKRLKVPKKIRNRVYKCILSFNEFIEYGLDDKIPTSCIIAKDRQIVEKFGIEKSKTLDWELLNNERFYYKGINFKELLMSIESSIEDVNAELYELVKDRIRPRDYSSKMKKVYSDRLFELSQNNDENFSYEMKAFNDGEISLKEIVRNWNLFKDKDLSYCLLIDKKNINGVTDSDLKQFMADYETLVQIISDNIDIYSFINEITTLASEEEKKECIKRFTDDILSNTRREYGNYNVSITLTNEEYKEIFKYSSLEDFLQSINSWKAESIIKELRNLPQDYVFNMSIPFSSLLNKDVLYFIGIYGLKNIVDFNNECGHFFTKNNCEMLKLMYDMYLYYPNNLFFTNKKYDDNGNLINRPYTKDEFYEAMKRMIISGPTKYEYKKAPDYRDMTGEFRVRNAELFISEQAPEELQKLFYAKSITPQILAEHPEFIQYLDGKDLGASFKSREIKVEESDGGYNYKKFYNFISSKTDFNGVMNFIVEYGDVFDIVFDRRMSDSYGYEINFSIEDSFGEIQKRINESFRRILLEKGVAYPKNIPQNLITNYPSLFLSSEAPKELQEAFYNRTINSEFILSNLTYRNYLENIDLEVLYKYMPVSVIREDNRYEQINLITAIKQTFGVEDGFDVMLLYGKYIESVFEVNQLKNFKYNPNFSKYDLLGELDSNILRAIIDGKMKYDDSIPSHFKNNNPTLFLSQNVPEDIRKKFYNREFTLKDFDSNPDLLEVFGDTNIVCGFSEKVSWMIPLFNNSDDFKIGNFKRLKVLSSYSNVEDSGFQMSFKKYVINHLEDLNIENITDIEYLLKNITNFEKFKEYITTIKEKDVELIFENLLEIFSYSDSFWAVDLIKGNDNISNIDIFKIISLYNSIEDSTLKGDFKGYVMEVGNNIEMEKIENVSEVLLRLSLSNSSEIFTFRKELAKQILKSSNPLKSLSKIEDVFIRNNIPTVGKIYSCFEILHPDFQGFNFDDGSMVSPVLKKSSTRTKKIIVFSDLIKSSFGSNNKSINSYLENIEIGSKLYESIKNEHVQYDALNEIEKNDLIIFSKHLKTLYNNTLKGKKEAEPFISTGNILTDILELSKVLSPDGTLDYNLADRIVRMFCGFAGIDTLEEAKAYVSKKIQTADIRNRNASCTEMTLEQGDFVKGIGGITYLRNILQNGSVSKEYLGSSAGSDATPLDTDISMVMSSDGTIRDKINSTAARGYGPIWFVLKNDERFITTRTNNETLDTKRDISKIEAFYTGAIGEEHYGIRTGFASSEINYIVMEKYDPRVGLEIAMNGFYIPVANTDGKIVFTPNDYDILRKKMNGLSYYEMGEYVLDDSIYNDSEEILNIVETMEENKRVTKHKANLIKNKLNLGISELGLSLKENIDLSNGSVILFNTGSTGRFTNLPGDGDFDYTMQVDRDIYSSVDKMNELRNKIIAQFSNGNQVDCLIIAGDIRELKTIVVDEQGNEYPVEIDITFTVKTDKTEYASDVCVSDRLNNISSESDRELVKANIIFAKKFLKSIEAYKPARKLREQGGMGGIGVENWILQNGGSFYSAAKSFVEVANKYSSFEEFKKLYSIPNFGYNHMAVKKGFYPHDNYIENMNEIGYEKMKQALNEYINNYEYNQNVDKIAVK